MAPPAHLDQLALQENEENKARRVSTVSRVCLATKGHPESRENLVIWVFPEKEGLWVRLDRGENVAFPEREENLVRVVCQEPRESPEHQAQTGQRVALVQLAH